MKTKHQGNSSGDALIFGNKGRPQERDINYNRRRSKSIKRSKSRGRHEGYWFCGKEGYTKKNCWSYKKVQNQSNENGVNTTCEEDEGTLVSLTSETTTNVWMMDSSASFHATSCREVCKNYQEHKLDKVYLGDN